MVLKFGRHRDKPVSEVPTAYLRWCLDEVDSLTDQQREAFQQELDRRAQEGPQQSRREASGRRAASTPPADVVAWLKALHEDLGRVLSTLESGPDPSRPTVRPTVRPPIPTSTSSPHEHPSGPRAALPWLFTSIDSRAPRQGCDLAM